MKRILALFLIAITLVTMLVTSVGAVPIEDDYGEIVGTATLTHTNYVYKLVVRSEDSNGSVYARIYLYDSNRNTIDGGWDSGTGSMTFSRGEAGVRPYYKSIWAKAQGYRYVFYDEY